MTQTVADPEREVLDIRPMTAADMSDVDGIYRLAFGTEFNLEDPLRFREGSGVVPGRFAMFPDGCFVAHLDGRMVGFGIANRWGSVGFLGPICVHPAFWSRGIARKLIAKSVAQFDVWKCAASGLFTNPSSPRHIRLYQSFGFWPRALTIVMSRQPVSDGAARAGFDRLGHASTGRADIVDALRRATQAAFAGMDLTVEIEHLLDADHGEIVYARHGSRIDFALCHYGHGSEGGPSTSLVKYAQVAPGDDAPRRLAALTTAILARAADLGLAKLVMGVNSSQHHAYRTLLDLGFRGEMHGARMHRPYLDLLDGAESYVLADWR